MTDYDKGFLDKVAQITIALEEKSEYERGVMEKLAEFGIEDEMVKQAFIGALGRAAKSGFGKLTGKLGSLLGRGAAEGGTRQWLADAVGKYGDDLVSRVARRRDAIAMAGKPKVLPTAANMSNSAFTGGSKATSKEQVAAAQKILGSGAATISPAQLAQGVRGDRMAGLGVLGGGGLLGYGMLSGGGGGGQPQQGMPMNQYGQPFDPMAANINQRMVMPSGYGRMPTSW